MNEVYFENVTGIGDLYLEHIFYEFESEPILFVCEDKSDKLYLSLCSEIRGRQKWLLSQCSVNLLKLLLNEKIDVASAFRINSEIFIVEMDLKGNEKSYKEITEDIDELDLPKAGIYVRCEKEEAENYIWKKELNEMLNQSIEISYSEDENICANREVNYYNVFNEIVVEEKKQINYVERNSKIKNEKSIIKSETYIENDSKGIQVSNIDSIVDFESYLYAT